MRTHQLLALTMTIGLALSAGRALAFDVAPIHEVTTIRLVDRSLGIVELADGTQLRTLDSRMLDGVYDGERVTVDYVHDKDENTLTTIAPADSEAN